MPRICFAFAALEEWKVQLHWKFAWYNWYFIVSQHFAKAVFPFTPRLKEAYIGVYRGMETTWGRPYDLDLAGFWKRRKIHPASMS